MILKRIYFLIGFIFLWFQVLPSWAGTYASQSVPYEWIDASKHTKLGPTIGGIYSSKYQFSDTGGCGTKPPSIDDTLSDEIPLGFTFTYGGVKFTSVRIMSNGRMQFNNNTTCGFGSPVTQLPYPIASLNYSMRIYGNDLDPSLQSEVKDYATTCNARDTCYVSFASLGTAPDRSFAVTWSNVPEWTTLSSASGAYNLQLILQENGEFFYHYGSAKRGPASELAQVGWQLDTKDYAVSAIGFPKDFTAFRFYIPGLGGDTPPSNFNGFDSSTAAGAITGVIKTKVAGSSIKLDVIPLDISNKILTQFNGDIVVELVNDEGGSCSKDPIIGASPQVLTFKVTDKGRKTVVFTENDAWQNVRLRVKYPTFNPTVIVCSSDNFAIRPASLSGIAKDADWTTAGTTRTLSANTTSGTPLHKAGQPFTLLATAYNTVSALTAGYNGSPVASLTSCLLPASGCINGVFSAGAFSNSGGTATSNTASYSEVGAITATFSDIDFTAIDAKDGSSIDERTVYSAAFTIGRFIPDHFAITAGTATPACSTVFTYFGQDGFSTLFTLIAQNSSNATTKNYNGSLARLGLTTWSGFNFTSTSLPIGSVLSASATAPVGTWSQGIADVTAKHQANKPTAVAAETSVVVKSAPIDPDGVTMTSFAVAASTPLRYGRLALQNTHGSELLQLPVSLTAQYWNGTAFVLNTSDSCTTVTAPASGSGLTFYTEAAAGVPGNHLSAAETTASVSATGKLVAGDAQLKFTAPGNDNDGYFDLSITAPNWLKFDWNTAIVGEESPSGRATFGIYKGNDSQIYLREVY